ncbi:hypothetical protein C1637_01415 [Chryseobacterium lactis]|uniref:DUF748 domain-containing protein n=1 Tax=Chryseobacterium lactis TaxID=1241981 RepID=A0A3G6RMS6_CHRLC|nr:hypothetical protein [Chryseobacterium lactis]AZA81262.1 hypothetical protein EG342_04800 [Chryseobacterium lactis]AZB06262.1 hypothetical protein EG341_20925 [Chryseobacterium lactis]PNW15114.1 hypothetical protein C1637_01415 [Chryseobacterium lactis]
MNKWVKRTLIGFGIVAGIILAANFGLNLWLKTQLPGYIKKNTDYKVSYKTLDVDLGTGNIWATGITVNNKNPQNTNVIGLQGTIDTLKINRFGIYDAIFNKTISSSDLLLAKPNLNIILAKPVDRKTGKKRNPLLFENIHINNGKIAIFKHTKQKFLSVQQLNLFVENLQMTEESVEDKLPVVFDHYSINGKDFFFRPKEEYAITIHSIDTENGQMSVENFKLIPLLSFNQFKKFFPKKTQLFEFAIPKMDFKDIVLTKNKVSLANADFQNPVLTIYKTGIKSKKTERKSDFEIDLENIKVNNAVVQVNKPDGSKLLSAGNLNVKINKLLFSKETSEQIIPVGYKDFTFSGKDIAYSDHQNINIGSIALKPTNCEINNISLSPGSPSVGKTTMDLKTNHVAFNINKLDFVDKKLVLDLKDVLVENLNGTIKAGENKQSKNSEPGIIHSVIVRKVSLKNSNITYDKGKEPLAFHDLNATVNDIKIAPDPNKQGLSFDVKDYFLTTRNFAYKTQFYNMSLGLLKLNKNKIQINNFAMKPLVSRAQFIKMIPVERDLYDLKAGQITAEGSWDVFSKNKFINASQVTIQSADANIFRSKIPKDDPKIKALYSKMLRSIKIPMTVANMDLKNSVLVYEEDTPESMGPGKLTFSNFNMHVKNLNSAKTKGKPTKVDIKINCSFMNLAPLSVNWNFDVADQKDAFGISGKTTNLPASGINPFIRPYLHVTATAGTIQEMLFNFKGNPSGLHGTFNMKHKDLKIAVLDKHNHEKKGFLTAVVNVFLKSDSGSFPESVAVENVERDPTKSFFNLFWKGIEQGLKKTLIGKNVEKTEKKVKNAVSNVKEMKQSVKEIKQEIKSKVALKPEEEKKEKKGFLNKIFKKKEKSDTE